jgi:hypothetical protein
MRGGYKRFFPRGFFQQREPCDFRFRRETLDDDGMVLSSFSCEILLQKQRGDVRLILLIS